CQVVSDLTDKATVKIRTLENAALLTGEYITI
ncbi:MAG: hypothetical protein ACJAQ0_001599, partial [Dasania sp.]